MTTQNSNLGYVPSGYNYIINPCFEVNQRGVASVDEVVIPEPDITPSLQDQIDAILELI